MDAERDDIKQYGQWGWRWATALCTGGFFSTLQRGVVSASITEPTWKTSFFPGMTRHNSLRQLRRCLVIKKSGRTDL